MKKARLALTLIIILAITGAAVAYKASRLENLFYAETTTTTLIGTQTQLTTICTVETWIPYVPAPNGTSTLKVSTAPTFASCPVMSLMRST